MAIQQIKHVHHPIGEPPKKNCSLQETIDHHTYLRIKNCFDEFTEEQKEIARKNLGIEELTANSVTWGNILGDITEQEDLINLLLGQQVDLSDLATKTYVDSSKEHTTQHIQDMLDKDYATKVYVQNKIIEVASGGELTLDGYATEQYVDDKFNTSTEETDNKISNVENTLNERIDAIEQAGSEELQSKFDALDERIDKVGENIPTNVSDLTNDLGFIEGEDLKAGYYNKGEVDAAILAAQLSPDSVVTPEQILNFATKSEVQDIEKKIPVAVSELDNDVPYLSKDNLDDILEESLDKRNLATKEDIEAIQLSAGNGIPIYDHDQLELMGENVPDKYISIPSEADMHGEVTNNTYTTSINSNYVDVLFQAIRQLQAEVARLRNSFKYGITSYTDTNTAMSEVLDKYDKDVENEPLWAIEEEGLSQIAYLTLGEGCELVPAGNVDVTEPNRVTINGTASWIYEEQEQTETEEAKDTKLILYLTTTGQNIVLNLKGEKETLSVDLSELGLNACDVYNYLLVLSRKQAQYGQNYLWVSATNYMTDNELGQGYWNGNGLQKFVYELDDAYSYESINFTDLTLSKFDLYSKYQDFTKKVIPSKPDSSDFKYEASHITIRSCATLEMATSIVDQLLENELVFISGPKLLYIKSKGQLVPVGSSKGAQGDDDPIINNGMKEEEVIQLLIDGGYITKDENGNVKLKSISELDFITFVNKETQKEFKFTCDAYGNLTSQEVNDASTVSGMLKNIYDQSGYTEQTQGKENFYELLGTSVRGTMGQLGLYLYTLNAKQAVSNAHGNIAKDLKLFADRLKIGAWYAPYTTDTIFGCSHAYIELENTSETDICLKGLRLYYKAHAGWEEVSNASGETSMVEKFKFEHIDLTGTIKKGSTYLIRGKQYANFNDKNCYIKVETFDQEWYDSEGNLIDLSFNPTTDKNESGTAYGENKYGFALIYQDYYDYCKSKGYTDLNDKPLTDFSPTSLLCTKPKSGTELTTPTGVYKTATGLDYARPGYYVDSRVWQTGTAAADNWIATSFAFAKNNSIIKNTFMLDPAKQAFQAHTTKESSRYRDVSNATDIIALQLNKEVISFPNSTETRRISNYTPKASFENKNISTDKSKLRGDMPNMVTCSFGRNPYTTRTFNWISCGLFDEYVWINIDGTWKKFSSYTTGDSTPASTVAPYRVGFNATITNAAYARITRRFPGDGTLFTSHKCIVRIVDEAVSEPTVFKYKVARDLNGQPDANYCSEEMQFTLYPTSYNPRIYQTSDQQGFHWVEYQVWNGAANLIENKINTDLSNSNNKIIPVLMNTGDMTQSGARINEWLDYYNAGFNLFQKFEQVNIVGNNDLCDTNPDILGTGDDTGKSNSYFFHLFYCYEIDPNNAPIINGVYLPSYYKIDFDYASIIMFNSEVTVENCRNWFKTVSSTVTDSNGKAIPINIYTGYTIGANAVYEANFKTVYEMMYQMLQESASKEKVIIACHEMPYTVITNANIKIGDQAENKRSLNGTSLIGCHCNQIDATDSKGLHWLSRLCEYFNRLNFNVRLFLGGHKHTYSCTYPVREFFYFLAEDEEGNVVVKNSRDDFEEYVMPETLEHDNCYWKINDAYTAAYGVDGTTGKINNMPEDYKLTSYDLTKFPLTRRYPATPGTKTGDVDPEECYPYVSTVESGSGVFYPYMPIPSLKYGITYLMDQATGYKLTSNKELPSANQKYSYIIPMTAIDSKGADAASDYQKRPIMIQVRMDKGKDYDIEIMAVHNVMNLKGKFDQFTFASGAPFFGWYDPKGDWSALGTGVDKNPWYPQKHKDGGVVTTWPTVDETLKTKPSADFTTTASPLSEDHSSLIIPLNAEADFTH